MKYVKIKRYLYEIGIKEMLYTTYMSPSQKLYLEKDIYFSQNSRKVSFLIKARWSCFDISFLLFCFSFFKIRNEAEYRILTFKILFLHSNWDGKSYFDTQNPILTYF